MLVLLVRLVLLVLLVRLVLLVLLVLLVNLGLAAKPHSHRLYTLHPTLSTKKMTPEGVIFYLYINRLILRLGVFSNSFSTNSIAMTWL